MPRTTRPPASRLHKARNLAVATIAGRDHYLGAYASPESHEKYARLIAEWHATPDAVIELPLGAAAEMQFDDEGNLVVMDHTWNRVWVVNYHRDPAWLRPLN